MPGAPALDVWWAERRVGRLQATRNGRLSFEYSRDLIDEVGLGVPVLSTSLPTSLRPYPRAGCHPFFDGLLPEGENRRIIAYDLGIADSDTFALLAALGRDCAGALSLIPPSTDPPPTPRSDLARPIDNEELGRRLRALRTFPLGVDARIRVSLGGVQEKLLLTRRADGWGLPTESSASTHLLKPQQPEFPGNIVSEALCLRFADALGVAAANVELAEVDRVPVLVVERYDRITHPGGRIERHHQEHLCQALAVRVAARPVKYEEAGGPSLRSAAALLRRWGDEASRVELLRQVCVNVLVGNADAHAMNTSILHPSPGRVTLAPMYDVFSSLLYPVSTTLGMFIGTSRDVREVGAGHAIAEATAWGIDRDTADRTVHQIFAEAPQAAATAIAATPEAAGRIADFLTERVDRFLRT